MNSETRAISLVAVDLDGTLLTSEKSLAPEGATLLSQSAQAGVHIILATTRNPDYVRPLCRSLKISDPIICTNGAQVWGSPDGPVWAYHTIPTNVALRITKLADTHDWELTITVGSTTYWRQRPGQALGPVAPNTAVVPVNSDAVMDGPVRILVHQPEAIRAVRDLCKSALADWCYAETYYNPDRTAHSLGVFPKRANKGMALEMVLERLGVEPESVLAIGDNPNDLPMFRLARVRVAMGNAPEHVKENSTVVGPSNNNEGVAWALSQFVLSLH